MRRRFSSQLVLASFGGALMAASGLTPAMAAPVATNDDFANATVVSPSALPHVDETDASAATNEGFEFGECCGSSDGSIWYRITPNFNGWLRADTSGSNTDTLLTIYRGTSSASLTEVACNYDYSDDTDDTRVTFPVRSGRSTTSGSPTPVARRTSTSAASMTFPGTTTSNATEHATRGTPTRSDRRFM